MPFIAPMTVRLGVTGIGIHAINHVIVPLIPPTSWHVGTVYHVISAPLYALLIIPLLRGKNWARIVITVLLGCQFAGRFVVWALWPTSGVQLALLAGWALSIAVLVLLWVPARSQAHFRSTELPTRPHETV